MSESTEKLVNCICFFAKPIYRDLPGSDYFLPLVERLLNFNLEGYF